MRITALPSCLQGSYNWLMNAENTADMTPEDANEYLIKLQTGRAQLSPDASSLEKQVFSNLIKAGAGIRQLHQAKTDAEKQIEAQRARAAQLDRDIEAVNGEQTAYAKILLAAENERRGTKAVNVPTDTKEKDKDVLKPSVDKKKPGPPKGKQPEHLNKKPTKVNGSVAPAEAAPEVKTSPAN